MSARKLYLSLEFAQSSERSSAPYNTLFHCAVKTVSTGGFVGLQAGVPRFFAIPTCVKAKETQHVLLLLSSVFGAILLNRRISAVLAKAIFLQIGSAAMQTNTHFFSFFIRRHAVLSSDVRDIRLSRSADR